MTLTLDCSVTVGGATASVTVSAGLTVADGETVVVLGPSGSGKTLLLDGVAGLQDATGHVAVDDRTVTNLPPEDRGLGYVFQEYALFPHLTVVENVAYGTRYHDDARDPSDVLADLGIADLADRSPATLSGGEKQRVALARSLVVRPDAFLLDEPLSALDAPTKARLRGDLADVLADQTTLYVTHDRTIARALADRVAVIADGSIRQVGTPTEVFERPRSPFVARFTGANCLPLATLPKAVRDRHADGTHLAIRPEHVDIVGDGADFDGTVHRVVREETAFRVTVRSGGERIEALTDAPPAGDRVGLELPGDRCHVIDANADGGRDSN